MKNKNIAKISYEPGADVLTWEVSKGPIDYAKEVGSLVIHFSENNAPVLVEILEASKFLTRIQNTVLRRNHIFSRKPVASTP